MKIELILILLALVFSSFIFFNVGYAAQECTSAQICGNGAWQCLNSVSTSCTSNSDCQNSNQNTLNTCNSQTYYCNDVKTVYGETYTVCSLNPDPNSRISWWHLPISIGITYTKTLGNCAISSCPSGTANCNLNPNDGCEVNVKTDPKNCGGCNNVCPSGYDCSAGQCVALCSHSNPSVSISPSTQSVTTGTPATYTVTASNNDNNCGTETFNLASSCGSASCSLSTNGLSVQSGGSSTATLTASSSSVGASALSVTATNAATGSSSSSAPATLTVTHPLSGTISPAAGGSDTTTISSTLSSSSDSFSCSELPAGASCTFNPASCSTPCGTTLTVSTTGGTSPGTYTMAVNENSGTQTSTSYYRLIVAGPSCNNDNICEFGETQSSCPSDCKTTVSISPSGSRFTPGQNITLTVSVNDSRIYAGEPIKLSLYLNDMLWSNTYCPISGTVITILNASTLFGARMDHFINKGGLANSISVTGNCEVPPDLTANYYTLSVVPQIFSQITLNAVQSRIYVYTNALEFLWSLIYNRLT